MSIILARIKVLSKMNKLPSRGEVNIKDLKYRDKIADPIQRHATTNFEYFSKTGKALSYIRIGFIGYELYNNPNYTIDDALIDLGEISRSGNSTLFTPSITFPADSSGNTNYYYQDYRN